ncbi:hypothetical protein GSS88_02700 [Corynebacterium sp. 3HC-13]|uniref:sensor histidine kinase n=1 Tax=Corynebacterium poyangense TaxID=2684405 RepID=UPI001CCDE592|nr:histidine kinase [Corynebacterium poyangense]MBZ8176708.1 hypothetical protein [Corynebacterium poyangense]
MGCYAHAQWLRNQAVKRYNEVTNATLHQRITLSRELHDVVGHGLTAIKVTAQTALYLDQPRESLTQILELTERSLADVRALVETLNGSDIPNADPAMIPYFIQHSGIHADLPDNLTVAQSWPLRYRIALVRAVQEICTNALKHGASPGTLALDINSEGFVLEAHNPVGKSGVGTGSGLSNIRDRISGIGTMHYEVHDGWFTLRICVP